MCVCVCVCVSVCLCVCVCVCKKSIQYYRFALASSFLKHFYSVLGRQSVNRKYRINDQYSIHDIIKLNAFPIFNIHKLNREFNQERVK